MNVARHEELTRRRLLASSTFGVGSVALAWLLNEQRLLAEPARPELAPRTFDLTPKPPHGAGRAKAMISLFMQGGPSHIDLLDPKPLLQKYHMQTFPGEVKYDNAAEASAKVFASPWKFAHHGQSGTAVSELLPHLAKVVDDITVIRSMTTGVNNHGQSIHALNTGGIRGGRPVLGSWLTYGLGSETSELPAYVALTDPGGLPVEGVGNWSNGFLPSIYQGTVIRPREPRILDLDAPPHMAGEPQRRYLDFVRSLNARHRDGRQGEDDLDARIASYELAARMQSAAREALDLSGEPAHIRELYGLDEKETAEYGARCLIARRLIERGVRFVQVFTRNQYWDHHGAIVNNLPAACRMTDRPGAALVRDLKQRGLLDTTIVHWGGEMGRLPVIQNERNIGRDHNTYGFSMWVAGGGFKGGYVHGSTDEFGHKAAENPVTHHDYHATLLHLFGLDPKRLIYRRDGREMSLLDGQSHRVVRELLA